MKLNEIAPNHKISDANEQHESRVETPTFTQVEVGELALRAYDEASEELKKLDTVIPFGAKIATEVVLEEQTPLPGKTRYPSGTGRDGRNVWDYAYGA